MRLLQQAVGQQSDCKRDLPLSADSCSCAAPFPMAAHQNATFMKELTKELVWHAACLSGNKGAVAPMLLTE